MLGSIVLLSFLALFIGGLAVRRYLPIEWWSLARDHSAHALPVVVGSAVVGALYFAYLRSRPFPPDLVRVVPLLWLAGCATDGYSSSPPFASTLANPVRLRP